MLLKYLVCKFYDIQDFIWSQWKLCCRFMPERMFVQRRELKKRRRPRIRREHPVSVAPPPPSPVNALRGGAVVSIRFNSSSSPLTYLCIMFPWICMYVSSSFLLALFLKSSLHCKLMFTVAALIIVFNYLWFVRCFEQLEFTCGSSLLLLQKAAVSFVHDIYKLHSMLQCICTVYVFQDPESLLEICLPQKTLSMTLQRVLSVHNLRDRTWANQK